MTNIGRTALRDGQILFVHHLHRDSVNPWRDRILEHRTSGDYLYTVKGKPRPILVISSHGERMHGVQWYWVQPETHVVPLARLA
jgi:hypothetical protein